ncbi:MAG: LysR family transcriptional regulator [Coxiellaceae bacterium]|nr:LysR family transcriptional regulator [Coxiellaceae bacterium]
MSLLSPQLQAFVAITKYHTVHAAAVELHVTQTAVTQRIRTLEAKLKTTLFVRTRRGMKLTPEGEALLRYCQAAKELEGQTMAHIGGSATESEVRLCITGPTSFMRSRIIPQCFPVMKQFPNLLMHFDVTDKEERDKALRAGIAEFAIVQPEHLAKEMSHKTLAPEEYVLVCSNKWKKRSLRDIIRQERIVDFTPADQMTLHYLKQHKLFDLARHERHFVNRTESLAMMLIEGYGYSLLTTEFAEPYLKQKKLMVLNEGKIYKNTMALVWYDRPEPPRYFQAIINAIQ